MQLELERQRAGILREAAQIFRQRGSLAKLLAEQVLGKDQLDGMFRLIPHCRERVEIGLGRDPPAQPAPLPLVNP